MTDDETFKSHHRTLFSCHNFDITVFPLKLISFSFNYPFLTLEALTTTFLPYRLLIFDKQNKSNFQITGIGLLK